METDFKCNSFNCRKALPCDPEAKAIVTTCSHIFCVPCANELFRASQICPACETSLTEPDDIVLCCLRPNNDYKTTVLAGLNPVTILEICGRAISFWNYQVSQENAFQNSMFKHSNEKVAQMQKHLDNVVREANGQITLLQDKIAGLERELDMQRRRGFDLQEISRERDKDYQKLKTQLDRYKRKAVLSQNTVHSAGGDAQDLPMEEAPQMLPNLAQQPLFGGQNGLLTTPSRRQRGYQPEIANTVHASRPRSHHLNPVQPQYPIQLNQTPAPTAHMQQGQTNLPHGARAHRSSGVRLSQPAQTGVVHGMPFPTPVHHSHRRSSAYQNTFPG